MNIPYEMFLTIQQMHLTQIRKIAYNHLQEKKDETCSKEQVMTVQEIIQNEESYDETSRGLKHSAVM